MNSSNDNSSLAVAAPEQNPTTTFFQALGTLVAFHHRQEPPLPPDPGDDGCGIGMFMEAVEGSEGDEVYMTVDGTEWHR